jgi:hypothetical protein
VATSVPTLLTRLAYRLGENSAPTNTAEATRRLSFLNEGYRKILSERLWWFTLVTGAQPTLLDQEIYTMPSDFRQLVELRANRKVIVPYPETDAFQSYTYPPIYYQYRTVMSRWFLLGTDELHIVPAPNSTGATFTVSSLTCSGTIATLTTSAAYSLQANDYIVIAGANESGYNGTHRITSVPTATTLTFTVESGTATPATGTLTAQHANLVYRYFRTYSELSATDTSVVIPDQFADILVAYAYGRYGLVDDSRASSADGFSEYNDLLVAMQREQTRRTFAPNAPTPSLTCTYP